MKNRRICLLVLLFGLILTLVSCGKTQTPEKTPTPERIFGEYGYVIDQDLTTTNIIDDNYRNYYEIFVRSFRDFDGDGIGDLQGVIEKLDYIKDLGFTGIWLMPINTSSSYHKYDVNNYYEIDPKYGTMADFEELIRECHDRGIKLIIDLVLNHSGSSNPLFKKALEAHQKALNGETLTEEEETFKDFYTFYDSKEDIPNGITAYKAVGGFYYEGNFSSSMPELNYDNPAVYEEVNNIMKFYLEKGVDGFRLDAVKYFYYNQTAKNVEVLRRINQMAKAIKPNAYIVGECWDSEPVIAQYYESGIDSFFNFPASVSASNGYLINGINRDGDALNIYYDGLLQNVELAGDYIPAPFLNNHDTVRFTSKKSFKKSKYQYALLSMLNGSTFTYYGDEVGMIGSKEVDQNVRIPILWGEDSGDCSVIGGVTTKPEDRYVYPTVSEQINDPDSFYNFYKKCNLIRNQNPEIARGKIELVAMDKETENVKMLFISKEYNGSKIGIIFNFSPYYTIDVNYKQYGFNSVVGQIVVENSEKYIGELEDGKIKMPSYSIAIVK